MDHEIVSEPTSGGWCEMGVVVSLGNILRSRHALTPHYHPAIPSSDIQEGIEVARVCAMAGVVLHIGRTWS